MLRQIYTLMSYLLQPIVLLLMWQRGRKQPEYRLRLKERYGFYGNVPRPQPNGVVIHAASVGEVIAATPLVKAIQSRYPTLPITLTTITPTGSARVKSAFGESVSHLYLPYDLPDAVGRFLDFVQPKLFIVIETELWPNLIHKIHQRHIPFVIANARLSPRSAKRYGGIKSQLQAMWREIDLILAQDAVSGDRYIGLGFGAEKLITTGNLKFDVEISDELRQKVQQTHQQLNLGERPVWIAGSTHEGEEKLILDAHRKLLERYPDLLLILVPRHPERFAAVEELLKKQPFRYNKRSNFCEISADQQVLFGDTMGEMLLLYGLAKVAFVGGSLVKHGGHNPLEPIAFKLPVISGVYTFNFPEIFEKLRNVNGVIEVESSAEALVREVQGLFEQPERGKQISQAGFEVLMENQGALQRHLDHLERYLVEKKQ